MPRPATPTTCTSSSRRRPTCRQSLLPWPQLRNRESSSKVEQPAIAQPPHLRWPSCNRRTTSSSSKPSPLHRQSPSKLNTRRKRLLRSRSTLQSQKLRCHLHHRPQQYTQPTQNLQQPRVRRFPANDTWPEPAKCK